MRSHRFAVIVPAMSVVMLIVGTLLLFLASQGSQSQFVTSVGSTIDQIIEACTPNDSTAPTPNASVAFAAVADPARILLPTIGVDASVAQTGIDAAGVVEIPKDVHQVGWYTGSAKPGGSEGSAVIVGHRDGALGIDGAFYDLGQLKPGDPVQIVTQDGKTVDYEVVARQVVAKTNFADLAPKYFSTQGSPRLTLVTCGGTYIKDRGGYQSNVIVTAMPKDSSVLNSTNLTENLFKRPS